jgi:hypothetical protein
MDTFGDIFTKISVHFVLNYMLHYYVCTYFMGYSCVCYMCILLLFYMNLCIFRMYLSILRFIYKVLQEFQCVYVLILYIVQNFYVA